MEEAERVDVQIQPGDWVLFRSGASYERVKVEMKQAESVTPRLVKFAGHGRPRQCSRLGVVAAFANQADAEHVRDGIAGVAGEFARRRTIAETERSAKITAALAAAQKQIDRLVASRTHPRPQPAVSVGE